MAASAALQRALLDFGEPFTPFAPVRPAAPAPAQAAPSFSRGELDAAVALAEARLRETLEREHAAAVQAAVAEAVGQALGFERQRHAEALQRVGDEQAAAAAAAIAGAMAALREEVGAEVAGACARLIRPLLTEDAAQRAVAALAGVLRDALEDGGSFRVTLSGPPRLRAMLKEQLEGLSLQWVERDADGFDLSAAFGTQLLETRLAHWTETLSGAEA